MAGFNPDDGFLRSNRCLQKEFVRFPFEYQRKFTHQYFAFLVVDLIYKAYSDIIKDSWSLSTDVILTSENYARNFFGYGNETSNNDVEKELTTIELKFQIIFLGLLCLKNIMV